MQSNESSSDEARESRGPIIFMILIYALQLLIGLSGCLGGNATTKADPSNKEPAPLPTNSAPRKPKVELRPAPVRTKQSAQSPPAPTKAPPEPHASVTEQGNVEKSTASSELSQGKQEEKKESLLDVTKADILYAQTHGVLVPPPADASTLGRFWHQAKELFVRPLPAIPPFVFF